jgi:serine phosphatase RsbU (regulator of sigma subunit)
LFNIRYYSTCVYGVIDTTEKTWTYCVAGHPAPLLIRDGTVEVLDGPHGPPLAALPTADSYKERVVRLQDGDLLALYSDGLVERRGERLDEGIRRLGERLRMVDAEDNLNDATKAVVADLVGEDPPDDVVIVLARYATTGPA